MAHRTDKADFSLKSFRLKIPAWSVSKSLALIGDQPAETFLQKLLQPAFCYARKFRSAANRHHLNKPHMDRILPGKLRHSAYVLLFRSQRNAVDLYRDFGILQRFLNALQGFFQKIPSCDIAETFSVKSVETDVDPVHSRGGQTLHLLPQKSSVCGNRYFPDPRNLFYLSGQFRKTAVQKRLSSCKLDLGNAKPGHYSYDPQDLLLSEKQGTVHQLHPIFRHTVDTAKIAPVRHRDPQIINFSSHTVYHDSSKRKSPLFPPVFSTRWISDITICLSIALHMS